MTILGGSEDVVPDVPRGMSLGAEDAGARYRQDDAPPGADPDAPTVPSDGSEPVGAPTRDVSQILATLAVTPGELARLIEGQSDEALAQPASDGEWGVVEIVPHLRDWEEVYLSWIHRTLEEDVPRLDDVDDSLWAIEHDYANEDVPGALSRFTELRQAVGSLLEELEPDAWQREMIHPRLGRITLHQLADRMCDHDARHIEQARDALA